MKKQITWHHLLVGVLVGLSFMTDAFAREIRNPLALQWGYWHYPYPRPKDEESCWNVDAWGAGYFRSAHRAFKNAETLDTEPLDGIFFGSADFFGIDSFAPGTIDPLNPFLSISLISPRISYDERGAFFGLTIDRTVGCNCDYRIGLRADIPFRDIGVELDSCCADFEDGDLDSVRRLENEQVPDENGVLQVVQDAFAYRLDFLSALRLTVNPPQEPLVIYNNPNNNDITMNQIRVSDQNGNPINVINRDDGTVPTAPFTLRQTTNVGGASVNGLPFLAADGSGVANNNRARFSQAVNYTPLGANPVNQTRLWVVPTGATVGTFDILADARDIQTIVEQLVRQFQNTNAVDFFVQNGFDFNTQRTMGPGDMNLEFYLHRDWCNWYGELLLGFRVPTGKRLKDPKLVFKQPLGNNGHFEAYTGFIAGWEGREWVHIKGDGRFFYVTPRTEQVAATFAGATVKGLGPTVDARISWLYFVGDLDFTFYPLCNPRVGLDLGYQIYVKGKDRVHFKEEFATDFLGFVQPLDSSVIERRTNVTSHRIRAEIFQQTDNAEIFAGWMHTFAGRNSFKDTDWYLGLVIYF